MYMWVVTAAQLAALSVVWSAVRTAKKEKGNPLLPVVVAASIGLVVVIEVIQVALLTQFDL